MYPYMMPVLLLLLLLHWIASRYMPLANRSTMSSLYLLLVIATCCCFPAIDAFSSLQMKSNLVVISPPGGVGQVTAVKAATLGNTVKWFCISQSQGENVALSQQALAQIEKNGGSVELAGATANTLLENDDDDNSALSAITTWCSNAHGLVCCMDGVQLAEKGKIDEQDPRVVWENAIKVAAQQASKSVQGMKLAILPASDDSDDEDSQENNGGGMGGLLKAVIGGNKVEIPSSLSSAMGGNVMVRLRHGDLFGIPESSPNFSALVGGPRKDAMLCEEYTMRTVRMDPSLSVSGGVGTRSSRHAVGEAAALIATGELPLTNKNLDVCISSQVGTDVVEKETWLAELKRVEKMLESGQGAQLFTASFSSVPDVERLADWLATKWAPAVLRTYDIAAIRVGARPVYASRSGEGQVEIVWQQLDDFESVTAGKMLIQVSNDGLVATRAAGDATKGYGSISRQPLPGETVLVRRLADAASQAIEKGLANKPITAKQPKLVKKKVEEPVVVSSVQSSGTVQAEAAAPSLETGPRTAGARRSSERARGSRKKRKSSSSPPNPASNDGDSFQ